MNPVVHFEMPAIDKARVKKFYENVFGWKMTQLGKDMGNYLVATTSPVDKNNMHKKKGAINGGFFKRGKEGIVPHIIIGVDDVKESINLTNKSGGKVLGKPMKIPGIGQFVMFKDTEGNRVGMLQPRMR
jgi:predicted enzyme related to lactoylglutathione lyase